MRYKDYITTLPLYRPTKQMQHQPAGVAQLSSNENPLGPSPRALAAMQAAVVNIHRYP